MAKLPIAEQLSEFVAGFDLACCPPTVMWQARRVLMDTLGCMVAGSRTPVVSKLLLVLEHQDVPQYVILGRCQRLGLLNAPLVNGTAAHALDLDDGHTRGSAHPGSVVIPAILSVAEKQESSLGSVLGAIIVGYEVMLSIAATIHPSSRKRGFHNTPVAGVFGAAAATARLLGLSPVEICNSFGLAGSFASGLLAFWNPGEQGSTDVKKLHPGKAARDGVLCALSAAQGLRGPKTVLEGPAGLFRAYSDWSGNFKAPTVDLQEPEIMQVYFKPWPCCRSLHGPIALALQLRDQLSPRIAEIAAVRVETYSQASDRSVQDAVGDDAQFSIPVAVALAIQTGNVTYDGLVHGQTDPTISALARLVSVQEDCDFSRRYPSVRPARLVITTKTGQTLSCELDYPPGEPQTPVSDAVLAQKFSANCAPIIGEDQASKAAEFLQHGNPALPFTNGLSLLLR
jgi:2-methylcitrate dehydratase PrpD